MSYQVIRLADVPNGKDELRDFLSRLQTGQEAFRYFRNRPVDIVDSHFVTLLIKTDAGVLAYGHLEEEGSRLWLGIAVADSAVGKGWGKVMMGELIAEAGRSGADRVSLRVDVGNNAGIRLYQAMGFAIVENDLTESSLLMEKRIAEDNAQ